MSEINSGTAITIRHDEIDKDGWIIVGGQVSEGVYGDIIKVRKIIWDFDKELRLKIISGIMTLYG